MAKKESKEIEVKKENPVSTEVAEWGESDTIAGDILIPKILLMQGTSEFVASEEAETGHLVNSVTKEKLGSAREKDFEAIKVIPLRVQNVWMEYEKLGDKLQFNGMVPRTQSNDNLPLEYVSDEKVPCRRDKTIMLFCLLEKDLKEDFPMPYVITFKRTSYQAGRAISTHFSKCDMARRMGKVVPPFATTFELGGRKKSNDQNTWYVFDWTGEKHKTVPEAMELASQWEKTLRTQQVAIDESDELGAESEALQADAVADNSEFQV
jgi:hypothetical protein